MSDTAPFLKLAASILLAAMMISVVLVFAGNSNISYANSITVNTTEDEDNNDGDCSLREAIKAASNNTSVDNCGPGSAGPDTISFNLGGQATIVLTDELVIKNYPLTINGPGTSLLTISGGNNVRVFNVDSAIPVTLTNLTIANGDTVNSAGSGGRGTAEPGGGNPA
jgi:CSLREA domain-containing protein